MTYQPYIVVIGAGIVGLSTAYALLEQGLTNVLVLEQAVVNHSRSTSSSISRLLRFEYGSDPMYARMVKLSLELWRDLERKTQKVLYTPTGLLALGNDDETKEAFENARRLGLAGEYLSPQNCQQRFPQFESNNYNVITYNTEGGILHASVCLQTLKKAILDLGGRITENRKVKWIAHENASRPIRLHLDSDEEVSADRVVVAIGPWVHRLLCQIHLPIELTRQYLLYFSGLSPTQFGVGTFPAFMDPNLYGFPIHKGSNNWLKAASHRFGRSVDPDAAISLEENVITDTVENLLTLLPALRNAQLAYIEACIYDVSPDEDFILDVLPDDSRIAFATGLSGHGFKFGLLLGQLLSSLIRETQPEFPLARFRLARFSHQHQRQVSSVA